MLEHFLQIEPALPRLPLAHSTDMHYVVSIVSDGRLAPLHCDVFGEDLVYLFYGAPMYHKQTPSTTGLAYRPVALLFRPEVQGLARDVYPFDSGAFHKGLFKGFIYSAMGLSHFRVHPGHDAPGRIVARFFQDNSRYLYGEPAIVQCFDVYSDALYQLYGARGEAQFDERNHAIELVLCQELPLSGNILAVIMPQNFADMNPEVVVKIHSFGAEVIGYFSQFRFSPERDSQVLFDRAMQFLRERRYI